LFSMMPFTLTAEDTLSALGLMDMSFSIIIILLTVHGRLSHIILDRIIRWSS
jgi:hypothetical protein